MLPPLRGSDEQPGQQDDPHPLEKQIDMLGIRGDVAQKCWNKAETQANQYSDVNPLFIDYHRLAMIVPVKSGGLNGSTQHSAQTYIH
jgi:hypothetical protein